MIQSEFVSSAERFSNGGPSRYADNVVSFLFLARSMPSKRMLIDPRVS